jgi:hypothetical protein
MTRVAIDNLPTLARPDTVERAVAEARKLRDRAREATEAVAAAQATVDDLVQRDVEDAAAWARAGEPLGTPGAPLRKAKDALALAQRDLAAIRLAQEGSEEDVAKAIGENADAWTVDLRGEAEQAREAGRTALAALQDACLRLGDAASAEAWLAGATTDSRYDGPTRTMLVGVIAPSSRRVTANSEPLGRDPLLGYLDELLAPPTPAPPIVETPAAR